MASPRSLPCDPLRREIGHCAFLAPARLACTTTPAVFNFGDFWLELAARMVSTGLNQGGGGVSDPVRSLIRLGQSWEIGTIVDMCGYYTQTQARLHSRLIPANYPHVTPCYWGGGVLGGGRGPSVPTFDSLMQHCWGGLWPINCFVIPHRLALFKRRFCVFLHRKYKVFDRLDFLRKC